MFVPLGAAVLALTAALAAYVMVKFYGVVFLGQPREETLADAHDANWLERIGLAWLALGCILIGVMPQLALRPASSVTGMLLGQKINSTASIWWIAPIASKQASYSGLILLLGIVGVVGVTYLLVRLIAHGRARKTVAWDCGYPHQTARMQDTAEGFGQPIRHMFGGFFRMEATAPSPADRAPQYSARIEDRLWRAIYLPIARAVQWIADGVGVLQGGSLSIYLLCSFLTLIVLLVFVL
jgi:NADH:ubiquinone oxidoreductase subunit 5 (subunit L)/multisubunit Na+/H+ antiporter MnhA subunit